MNLGTAGAILSYALDLEVKSSLFYQKVLAEDLNSNIRETIESIWRQHQKITKTLDRIRKENVTEMILEPIHDYNSDDFVIEIPQSVDITVLKSTSRHIEETLERFLSASAERVVFLPELSQTLADLAEKVGKNLESLLKIV